jgi:hypothetical protein
MHSATRSRNQQLLRIEDMKELFMLLGPNLSITYSLAQLPCVFLLKKKGLSSLTQRQRDFVWCLICESVRGGESELSS